MGSISMVASMPDEDRPPAGTACEHCQASPGGHYCPAVTYSGDAPLCSACASSVACERQLAIDRLRERERLGIGPVNPDAAIAPVRQVDLSEAGPAQALPEDGGDWKLKSTLSEANLRAPQRKAKFGDGGKARWKRPPTYSDFQKKRRAMEAANYQPQAVSVVVSSPSTTRHATTTGEKKMPKRIDPAVEAKIAAEPKGAIIADLVRKYAVSRNAIVRIREGKKKTPAPTHLVATEAAKNLTHELRLTLTETQMDAFWMNLPAEEKGIVLRITLERRIQEIFDEAH